MATPITFPAAALADPGSELRNLNPPAILGVFGDPIAHSRSPDFQNAALKACSIDGQYVRVHANADEFPPAAKSLEAAGFLGANVTIPHKQAALSLVDEADPVAVRAQSVNTLVARNGRLLGFSTDGPGLVRAIREEFYVDLRDLRVLILGAGGGAGRAIAVQCAIERCERLVLVNRTVEKALDLANELEPVFRTDRLSGPVDRLCAIPWEDEALRTQLAYVDLVINASAVGMRRTDPPPLSASLLSPSLMIYDTVYSSSRTRLVEEALAAGARAANGLSMLLHQGALAFEIWFDRPAPLDTMRESLRTTASHA